MKFPHVGEVHPRWKRRLYILVTIPSEMVLAMYDRLKWGWYWFNQP